MAALKRLLIVSDGVPHTGFGRSARAVIETLGARFDVSLLGLNSSGDPCDMGCPVYPAWAGGDAWGLNRLPLLLERLEPEIVLLIMDCYALSRYLPLLTGRRVIAWVPPDGELLPSKHWALLERSNALIPTTTFGKMQLERLGLRPEAPIGLGIDLGRFYPVDREQARASLGLPQGSFIVGCVQANTPRKRLDLMLESFARFWGGNRQNYLLYHGPRSSPDGVDIVSLASHYGFGPQLLLTHLEHDSLPEYTEAGMRSIYNALDVQITTSNGEGWGLPVLEGMACGIPQIVPDFAALGEWTEDATLKIPTPHLQVRPGLPTLGRCPDPQMLADALKSLHTDTQARLELRAKGLTLAQDPRFSWANIAAQLEQYL